VDVDRRAFGNDNDDGSIAMNTLTLSGTVLLVLGLLGFAIPMFTTQQTKDVANIGDLKLQTTESTSHVVPPILAGGVLILGVVLVGVGISRKR
jgi:hypothetical protein